MLLAVDPIGEEEEAMEEEEEERLEGWLLLLVLHSFLLSWVHTAALGGTHTYIISTSQRRRRWIEAAAAAEASHSNLTLVHAVEASRLPSLCLTRPIL